MIASEIPLLKVLSYNIHKGFNLSNRRFVLEQIRESIRTTGADLVFLQEVFGRHQLHASTAQFEYLADGVWSHFAYGKNAVYTEGHHGNAILSKYPIDSWDNLDISTNRWEQRGLLHACIPLQENIRLHAFNLHLSLLGDGRRIQVDRISEEIKQKTRENDLVILAGDFNDWNKKVSQSLEAKTALVEVHRRLYGRYAVTFPSTFPMFSLDRIYYGAGLQPLLAKAMRGGIWNKLSDHLALYSEFALPMVPFRSS